MRFPNLGFVSDQFCLAEELCKHFACVLQIGLSGTPATPKL